MIPLDISANHTDAMSDAQRSAFLRAIIEQDTDIYTIYGDFDKPFHRPECECDMCEGWREEHNRPTHKELRGKESQD